MHRAASATILFALLSAGCLAPGPVQPSTTPDPQDLTPAPAWRVGESWNYTEWVRGDDQVLFYNYTVVKIGPVGSLSPNAYHVRIRTPASHSTSPEIHERYEYYDVTTLHSVWDDCADPAPALGNCSGEVAILDFPLWEGKSWRYVCCGDDLSLYNASAQLLRMPPGPASAGGDVWRVSARANGSPLVTEAGLVSRDNGFWAQRVWYEWYGLEPRPLMMWNLTSHARPG